MRLPVVGVLATCVVLAGTWGAARAAPLMIVGNDEKLLWDDRSSRCCRQRGAIPS
jgi:hypothetical protein